MSSRIMIGSQHKAARLLCCVTPNAWHCKCRAALSTRKLYRHSTELSGGGHCCSVQSLVCRAQSADEKGSSAVVYQGVYGPWTVEPEDIAEVMSYRAGLTVFVAAFITLSLLTSGATNPTGPDNAADVAALAALNPLSLLGCAAFGLSLTQIHIYVTEIKRAIQALWLLGVFGGCYLVLTHPEQPLPVLVVENAWATLFVGPVAAAVTGVAIKEGLCYGKPEAAGLAVLLPVLCLSHLCSAGAQLQQVLLAAVCLTGAVFAARKYSQPVKDDIGDKSVFMFRKLSPEQQEAVLGQQLVEQAESDT